MLQIDLRMAWNHRAPKTGLIKIVLRWFEELKKEALTK